METNLLKLSEKWSQQYPAAVRSWEENWTELSTFFVHEVAALRHYPYELRRIIYTTNIIEGYNGLMRKVTKNKRVFSSPKSVRKLLFLAHQNIAKKWTMPIPNEPKSGTKLRFALTGDIRSNRAQFT